MYRSAEIRKDGDKITGDLIEEQIRESERESEGNCRMKEGKQRTR